MCPGAGSKMDTGQCNLIYYDPRASSDVVINESTLINLTSPNHEKHIAEEKPLKNDEVKHNIKVALSTFQEVHLVKDSVACVSKIRELEGKELPLPTIVLIYTSDHDHPYRSQKEDVDVSPGSPSEREASTFENLSGIAFLQQSKGSANFNQQKLNYPKLFAYGAADVLSTPLTTERALSLPAHAYRSWQDRPGSDPSHILSPTNKSPLQIDDTKPYAYLRESMVSGLMDRICNPGYIEKPIDPLDLRLSRERKSVVMKNVSLWAFSAHDYSDDELLYAAFLILDHVLQMPGLEQWRISQDDLVIFLMACRRVYNSFVIYHNFRHACDVLQAAFCFLLSIGAVPPYGAAHGQQQASLKKRPNDVGEAAKQTDTAAPDSAMSAIIRPFEAMTLVISCIGHDVGHPGVNNLFLVTLNAPLAQLYNDRSVLESFHCAAFSQILRRYWPAVFGDVGLRKLMINSILATDMSHHTHYLDSFQKMRKEFEDLKDDVSTIDPKALDTHRELLCCMLIKCADICNVARKYNVATEWADILTNEFANQANMEAELHLPSCLFGGPPVLNDLIKMATSQIGFMNIFAIPLFTGMSKALPGMKFTVDELTANKAIWERTIEEEKKRSAQDTASTASKERAQSPHARRGSAFAQSQMRADPMVFGSHSASSLTQTRRQSATVASDAIANAARRASLGPTVIPVNKSLPGSRRGSTGVMQSKDLVPQVQGATGIASGMGYDGHQSPLPEGSMNGHVAQSSNTGRSSSVQELISNPPGFLASDPSSTDPSRSDLQATNSQDTASNTSSPSTLRGRGVIGSRAHSGAENGGQQRTRSKTRRKLSLKFWRKSKSAEALSRDT